MDKKNIIQSEWENKKKKIANLSFSKKDNVHQFLTRYSDNGWTLNESEKKVISQYILFLEENLAKWINIDYQK